MKKTGAIILKQEIARESRRGNLKLQVSDIPFSSVPHSSRLFAEYQQGPVSLRKYYPNAVDSLAGLLSHVPAVRAEYRTDRARLCDALERINVRIDAGAKTFENIERLRASDTVAVVTGQQAGLFAGPLYTIYKALSAIKMAEVLGRQGVTAVPVFWTATEDHDFEEVSKTFFIDRVGALSQASYVPGGYVAGAPVGSVTIDNEIESVIASLLAELPKTEFTDNVRELMTTSWSAGTSFGDAFAKTLSVLLERYGLVFIDPLDETVKALSAPIYADAVSRSDAIVDAVIGKSRELASDGYHAQVLVEADYFPLFWHDNDGKRIALRKVRDGLYRTKGDAAEFTLSELEDFAKNEPQRFSPGVMLRPVVQDFLLPTICYLGGAAEIAYFAQSSEVYRVLGRRVTPIIHRQSFTVIEARHRRTLDKLGLDLLQLFEGVEKTTLAAAAANIAPETAGLFANVEETINTELNRLDQSLTQIDPTLAENLAKRRRKIMYHIAALRKKALLALTRKDETLGRQLESVFTALAPQGQLQERSVNVFTYLNKFGLNFIDWLYEATDVENKGHRVIDL